MVDGFLQGDSDPAQLIKGRHQALVLETAQTAELAAGDLFVDYLGPVAIRQGKLKPRRIVRIAAHAELGCVGTHHQGLAIGQGNAYLAGTGRGHPHTDNLSQLADGFVTLVQQVVGRIARGHAG